MAETSVPWSGGTVNDSSWRAMRRGIDSDGVVNDTSASSLIVTATGGSTAVSVSPGEAIIQGVHYRSDATVTLDVADVGTPPTSGQTRVDLVVLRYDPSQGTPNDRVRLAIKPGTPATSGAQPPALTRSVTGIWEMQVSVITRTGNVSVTSEMLTSSRQLSSHLVYVTRYADEPSDAPDGTVAVRYDDIKARRQVGGVMTWKSIISPEWLTIPLASGYAAGGRPPKYRVVAGELCLKGTVKRSTGASFGDGWLRIGSVPSSLLPGWLDITTPRVAIAMRDVVVPAFLELTIGGFLQLNVNATGQTLAYLDGARFPLE